MTTKHDMGAAGSRSRGAPGVGVAKPGTELGHEVLGWLLAPPSPLPSLADPNELLLASVNPPLSVSFMTRLRQRLASPSGTARRSWPVRAFEWLESREAWQRWLLTAVSGGALVLGLYQSAASSAALQVPSSARTELRAATPLPAPGPQPQSSGASDEPSRQSPLTSKAQVAERALPRLDSSTQPTAKARVKPQRSYKKHTQKARATRHGARAPHRRQASRLARPRS